MNVVISCWCQISRAMSRHREVSYGPYGPKPIEITKTQPESDDLHGL